jgi:hypothetical protein
VSLTFKGPNFSRSRSGWTPDALKSGLQKYVRRGEWRVAGRCAWELLEFSATAVTAAERTAGRALRTNLLNRMLICAAEDVGSADPVRMSSAMRVVLDLLEHPRSDARAELADVLAPLRRLAESRKSRNVSMLRSLLVTIPARYPDLVSLAAERGVAAGLTADEVGTLRALLAPGAIGVVVPARAVGDRRALDDAILALVCDDADDEDAEAALVVYGHLLEGRWAVVPAALRLLDTRSKRTGPRRVASRFWAMLRAVATATSEVGVVPERLRVLDALQSAHGRTREADVYVITALELFLMHGAAEWADAIAADRQQMEAEAAEAETIVGNPNRLELEPFVLDMHTRVGRAARRSAIEFLAEGSVVTPERVDVSRPLLKPLYAARKLVEAAGGEPEAVACMRTRIAELVTLGWDEQRQVRALLDLLAGMPSHGARSSLMRARATTAALPDEHAVAVPTVVPQYTSADFDVLDTMIGCIGGRKPLLRKIRMRADGRIWLLKPVKDGFYAWVDGQKARYGVEPIGMELVRVDGTLAVRMRFVERAVNLSRMSRGGGPAWYADAQVRRQYLRIAMFRVGLRVSDTSPYNTLAVRGHDGRVSLVSIDEMATTVRHDTPRILGGPRATSVVRMADERWARELFAEWRHTAGGPLDHRYLGTVLENLLGWRLELIAQGA